MGQLPRSYDLTADFVQFMNDLCDAFYSSTFCAKNKNRLPLSNENQHVHQILTNAIEEINDLKTVRGKVPPCFTGFIQTIRACLMLYKNLNENYNVQYLLTRRLTQDILENTFAIFRQKGGFNDNPTAKTFRLSFRHLFCSNLRKNSSRTNCEDDQYRFIFNISDLASSRSGSEIPPIIDEEKNDYVDLPLNKSVCNDSKKSVELEDCGTIHCRFCVT